MPKQSNLDELKQSIIDGLRTPLEADPFYADLERLCEEIDLAIPTVNLSDGEMRLLRALVKRWTEGEPVAGVIEQDFAFDAPGESRS